MRRRSTTASEVLGGARPKYQRPRGFVADWKPRPEKQALLRQVEAVLEEYRAYLPLTIRQVFYRLVAQHGFPKTEASYKNQLCEVMTMARRARVIAMEDIRDDSVELILPSGFTGTDAFIDQVKEDAKYFTLRRDLGQKTRLVVICEAAGMAPQLRRVADAYGVQVIGAGGFDSLTFKHDLAQSIAAGDRVTEVLHIGDHDPSGTHMFVTLMEDIAAFVDELEGEDTVFTRLAVTPAQVEQYNLPTAPAKRTDRRAFHGMTCQAEALAPDVMNAILREAIEERFDMRQLERVKAQELRDRDELMTKLDALDE